MDGGALAVLNNTGHVGTKGDLFDVVVIQIDVLEVNLAAGLVFRLHQNFGNGFHI